MQRIAVEGALNDVKDILKANGYEVVNLDPLSRSQAELRNCDAIVLTGMDRNFAGHQDVQTNAVVIDASGMTADEILNQVQNRLDNKRR
ncbi:MAG: YkuS family protein [Bacillota bacterium]